MLLRSTPTPATVRASISNWCRCAAGWTKPFGVPQLCCRTRLESVLQCPVDDLGVAVDADALVPDHRFPPAQVGRDLLRVLLAGRVVVDGGVDGRGGRSPAAVCNSTPRLACSTPADCPRPASRRWPACRTGSSTRSSTRPGKAHGPRTTGWVCRASSRHRAAVGYVADRADPATALMSAALRTPAA